MELTIERIKAWSERYEKSKGYMVVTLIDEDVLAIDENPEGYRAYARTVQEKFHDVTLDLACDCEDYQYNQDLHGGWCKRVMAEGRGPHA